MIGTVWDGPVIELRNLCRSFGDTKAVNDVSFSVPRGSVFGYIGPNGAGKTTSMRILATLELPTSGDAMIEGFSSINDPDRVRSRLGFMPDAFGTYADTNCIEYLDFFARSYGLTGAQRTQRLRYVIDLTGLGALARKPIRGLSKGMRQRLCLGRALVHDPAVLILDEPAAGLDPHARIELREMIRTLAADGKTILISSHILTELAEMCDRVGILEQGTLLATGSVEEMRGSLLATRELIVRLSSDPLQAAKALAEISTVSDLSHQDGEVRFVLTGDDQDQMQILKHLVEDGVEVIEYSAKSKSLEDVFLQVTQGAVQ